MKVIIFLSLFVAALAYSDLDDTFSFDDMIADKGVFKEDIDCLIGRKQCPPVLQKYKDRTLEAVSDICNECNDIEKHDLVVFVKALKSFPEQYKLYQSIYDPDGTRIPAIEEKLKNYVNYKP